jgi:disulfide bond formation protein DsbB
MTDDAGVEETGGSAVSAFLDLVEASARHIALLAAWIALSGSLFFSEVLGWLPCVLCWYQRILMYPLAAVLAIGILRRDRGLHLYVLPFSVLGSGVSLYHYLLIKTDWLPPPACSVGVPCNVDYLDWLGFINIPFLALTAFLIITCMMIASALLQAPEDVVAAEEPEADAQLNTSWLDRLDGSRLAVPMIIITVVLSFLLGSTFA